METGKQIELPIGAAMKDTQYTLIVYKLIRFVVDKI